MAVITAGFLYWNAHKKAIIKNKIESGVRDKSDGLYKIKYVSLEMDEIAGYLSIYNMNLSYDSTRYKELKSQGKEPFILLNIYIPQISVSGVKTVKALIGNEIVGRKLEIKKPVINIFYTGSGKDSSSVMPSQKIYEQILGKLDLIQADTILITGAQINSISYGPKTTSARMQNVCITLVNVKVDSVSSADTTRMFFAKEMSVTCEKMAWSGGDKLYKYSADSLSINSLSHSLRLKNFRVIPTLNEDAFVKAVPIHEDRFDFSADNIQAQNINIQQLVKENFLADSVLIGEADCKIYSDLAIPSDKRKGIPVSYPYQLIETIQMPFRVGKIILSKGFVEYKERNDITRRSGKVQFYNVYANITNFTNDKNVIAANNIMTADVSSQFMNKTPLKASWIFYLLPSPGRFDLKGSFGTIDLRSLNVLTEPMALVRIKKGQVTRAEFNFHGHDFGMDGNVKILYDDLKIAMLHKAKGSDQQDKKILLSFFANVIVKNSNPQKNENIRVVQVHYHPDIHRSFFNLTWKTLRLGIKQTAGLNK